MVLVRRVFKVDKIKSASLCKFGDRDARVRLSFGLTDNTLKRAALLGLRDLARRRNRLKEAPIDVEVGNVTCAKSGAGVIKELQ